MTATATQRKSEIDRESQQSIQAISRNLLESTEQGEKLFSGTTILLHLRLALYEIQHHHGKQLPADISRQIRNAIGR